MNAPRPARTGDRRAKTRDQLLAAAQTLLLDRDAGPLGIRRVTTAAGLVHGSFYNYYPDLDALLDDLAALMFASHAALVAGLRAGLDDPAVAFALITRQTLHLVIDEPDYGRLLFDSGLPVDRFVTGLRGAMGADIVEGLRRGRFAAPDVDIAISLTAGAILGAGIDLHRGRLPAAAIEPLTARLLEALGLPADEARRLADADMDFVTPPPLPLRWQAVPPPFQEALRAA